ncbi:hypothetical protein [Pseudomonas sp. EA_15y_Pfl2_R67]|uniref:hypothetical protein n=1 Tax=Pseudomonas sp. EA_15y_Pfl2_R67 TaxID=3088687 RepID=UPI0030D80368
MKEKAAATQINEEKHRRDLAEQLAGQTEYVLSDQDFDAFTKMLGAKKSDLPGPHLLKR